MLLFGKRRLTVTGLRHGRRLRYQAVLAERQFNRVDPDNRLVAAELERRWEAALVELRRAEAARRAISRVAWIEEG